MRLLLTFLIILIATEAQAPGWNDYEIDLENGFTISVFDGNAVLSDAKGFILVDSGDGGPIEQYAIRSDLILLRCIGTDEPVFYIVHGGKSAVDGPLNRAEFVKRVDTGGEKVYWRDLERPVPPIWYVLGAFLMVLAIIGIAMRFMAAKASYYGNDSVSEQDRE